MSSDIELEIGAGTAAGRYVVQVRHSASGGLPTGSLELDVAEILSKRELLEATVISSSVARRSVSEAERPVRDVGRRLFDALFSGAISGTYRASLGAAHERGDRLRVVLRLTAPELAALPWETLFDSERETYVCRQEPLVRHVPAPYTPDPQQIHGPLRILGVVASPRGLPPLDVEAEKEHLAEALAGPIGQRLIELIWAPTASWDGLHGLLLSGQWHVLHFVGHGDYDTHADEGMLALVNSEGRADLVEASRFVDLLGQARPRPQLVVLNSCSSGQTGSYDLFSSSAAALARSGISAVAAMQFAVSDRAAIAFARGFYTAIAQGRSVDEAAGSGRIAILGTHRSLEWVTPVLYVRGLATQLFSRAEEPAAPDESQAADRVVAERPAASSPADSARRQSGSSRALYVTALAERRVGNLSAALDLLNDLLAQDPDNAEAASLRDTVRSSLELEAAYGAAVAAHEAGDFEVALRGYQQVLGIDADYRDTAARLAACGAEQRIADLQAELRRHVGTGHWHAALEVSAELSKLHPDAADPQGLATRARSALASEEHADYLQRLYETAGQAEDREDWAAAADGYREIMRIQPDYLDARARLDSCEHRGRIIRLRTAITSQAAAGEWAQVLAALRELTDLDPGAAEDEAYAELSVRARLEVVVHSPGSPRRLKFSGKVRTVCWHPEVGRIVVAGGNLGVYFWDSTTGKRFDIINATSMTSYAFCAAYSPDGTKLAVGNDLKHARIFDLASRKRILELVPHKKAYRVAFSPDGTLLLTIATDENARIWDAASGAHLGALVHDGPVLAAAFNQPGTKLATASQYRVQIWNRANWQAELDLPHGNTVTAVAFSPDGTRIATAAGSAAGIWELPAGVHSVSFGHADAVTAVAFSPDGKWLATGSNDQQVRIWDAATGRQLAGLAHEGAVVDVAFSPDGAQLAACGGSWVCVWDVA